MLSTSISTPQSSPSFNSSSSSYSEECNDIERDAIDKGTYFGQKLVLQMNQSETTLVSPPAEV
ncbi:hypothetical protein BpHYR1_006460 [Brachionus plicatilis]|uniref:Uncharacterized protein n=1 Tax=Brachionus plicatilis TaxID=10195 RepID=A0A3M7P2I0_BRAPC|nr:hypothetical protein BpHYR1_006460 [Brachionus plicatilis]